MPLLLLESPNPITAFAPPAVAAATLDDITSADWSLMLDMTAAEFGLSAGFGAVVQGIDDINQCIAIILATPRGADYLRPTFGADLWQYIDQPITQSMPHLVREVTEALTLWEPRIKVVSVRAALVPANQTNQYGVHIAVTIVWQLKLSARYSPRDFQQHRTTVSITGALN